MSNQRDVYDGRRMNQLCIPTGDFGRPIGGPWMSDLKQREIYG